MNLPPEAETPPMKEGNPFDSMPMEGYSFRMTWRIYAVIACILLSPAMMVGLFMLTQTHAPHLVPHINTYPVYLLLNLPGAAALLFLPVKSAFKFIAAAAYWLILSPAVIMGTLFATLTLMCLFFGPC
jgi:hypothetical protein